MNGPAASASPHHIGKPANIGDGLETLATVHRLKLKPPMYTGDCTTFEEWKHKVKADMGLSDPVYQQLLTRADQNSNSPRTT